MDPQEVLDKFEGLPNIPHAITLYTQLLREIHLHYAGHIQCKDNSIQALNETVDDLRRRLGTIESNYKEFDSQTSIGLDECYEDRLRLQGLFKKARSRGKATARLLLKSKRQRFIQAKRERNAIAINQNSVEPQLRDEIRSLKYSNTSESHSLRQEIEQKDRVIAQLIHDNQTSQAQKDTAQDGLQGQLQHKNTEIRNLSDQIQAYQIQHSTTQSSLQSQVNEKDVEIRILTEELFHQRTTCESSRTQLSQQVSINERLESNFKQISDTKDGIQGQYDALEKLARARDNQFQQILLGKETEIAQVKQQQRTRSTNATHEITTLKKSLKRLESHNSRLGHDDSGNSGTGNAQQRNDLQSQIRNMSFNEPSAECSLPVTISGGDTTSTTTVTASEARTIGGGMRITQRDRNTLTTATGTSRNGVGKTSRRESSWRELSTKAYRSNYQEQRNTTDTDTDTRSSPPPPDPAVDGLCFQMNNAPLGQWEPARPEDFNPSDGKWDDWVVKTFQEQVKEKSSGADQDMDDDGNEADDEEL